jgi:Zn-dependent protease
MFYEKLTSYVRITKRKDFEKMINIIQTNPFIAAALVVGFLISLALHEAAHAYVAYRLGDTTAKDAGRLTLNPLAHLDPFGTLALFIFGFGWGKPVPYNPSRLKGMLDELKIALAGPFANILLAFVLAIGPRYAFIKNVPIEENIWLNVSDALSNLNILLAALNLLPIPPLDGSKLIMLFLSPIAKIKFIFYGQWLLFGLIVLQVVNETNRINLISTY